MLRWLDVEEYAKFSLAFGFQVVMASILDVGISGAIVNLVGSRGNDPGVLGEYMAATRWLRNLLLIAVVPLGAVGFYIFGAQHGWSSFDQATLFLAILATLLSQASIATHTAPLLVHQRIRDLYRITTLSALGRLFALGLVYFAFQLNAAGVYLITALATAFTALWARDTSRPFFSRNPALTSASRQELLRYVVPLAPGIIFFAFQGQITIFIMSAVGTMASIAEIGALGRLGLLFGTLSAVNGTLIGPYFARLACTQVPRRYALTIVAAIATSTIVVFATFLWPDPLLWLLGEKYHHMRSEAVWTVFGASITFVGALSYGIHLSRHWIFWWASPLTIALVVAVQAWMLIKWRLESAQDAIVFTSLTNLAMLAPQALVAIAGFRRDYGGVSRTVESEELPPSST